MHKRVTLILLAMLTISSFSFLSNVGADLKIQTLSVHMRGIITDWGTTPVFGWIDARAKMVNVNGTYHEWAGAHAMWSLDKPKLNCTKPPTENVTFSFYVAHLIKSTEVALNYSGYDLYIAGFWNVAKITTSIFVYPNGTLIRVVHIFEPIVTNATGELRVLPRLPQIPARFELAINGIDMLRGFVVFYKIAYFAIKICDTDDDGKVNIIDIVRIAKAYKTVPGMPGYNVELDFNFDYKIDLGDLTTLAANKDA